MKFENGLELDKMDKICSDCESNQKTCPIYNIVFLYIYDAKTIKEVQEIINFLIVDDNTCTMKRSKNES